MDSDSLKFFSPTAILEQSSPRSSEPSSPASCATLPGLTESALNEQLQLLQELLGRHPVSHYWDPTEPRLLVVESAALQQEGGSPFGRRSGSLENWLATKRRSGKHSQVSMHCTITYRVIFRVVSCKYYASHLVITDWCSCVVIACDSRFKCSRQ